MDMDKIDELLTRGVEKIYPSKENLEKVLRSGKKLKLYQGFDPTGNKLHIGHMVGLRKLRQWQELGHHVIFLIGDFTAMIGDPSGKSSTRKILTHEEVLRNAEFYKEQAKKILDFDGANPIELRFNSEWLGKLSAIDFIKITRLLSVQQVVERDMFQKRQQQGQDIYMNEFLYPVMQAYDSVFMKVDLEIGGKDQMFNMLMGRKLMRNMIKKDKFVMTTPLLTDSNGVKIGKTEGNVMALTDKPEDLFVKIMTLPDDVIVKGFEYLTDVSMEEIEDISKTIENGKNPVAHKKRLAFEIVKQLNDDEQALNAQKDFEKTVRNKEMPNDMQTKVINGTQTVIDVLIESGLVSSKSEAKRLMEQDGVTLNDKKITNPDEKIEEGVLKVGKRNFVKIKTAPK